MTATTSVPLEARASSWRWAAWAAIVVSLAFFVWDGTNAVVRPDLAVELIARLLMIGVAATLLIRWRNFDRHAHLAALLVWGLIGLSLDVYWQVAYDSDTAPLRLIAMLLKYAGVSAGLGCFIALTASFGKGDRYGIRRALARYGAPSLAAALFVVGVVHGVLWLQSCGAAGVCFGVLNPLAIGFYQAYLALDVVARLAIVAAAWMGLVWSSTSGDRLVSIALASTVLSLGTVIDFASRLAIQNTAIRDTFALFAAGTYEQFVQTLQIADSLATLIFGGILALALYNRTLFGLSRYATYLFVGWIFLVVLGCFEGGSHSILSPIFEKLGVSELPANLILATSFAFILHKPEEWMLERIERIRGDLQTRMEQLRELRTKIGTFTDAAKLEEEIVAVLTGVGQAEYAQLFLRHRQHSYRAKTWSPKERSCDLVAIAEKDLPHELVRKFVCAEMEPSGCLKGAVLALPMPVAGKLYGFIACGPKQSEDEDHFTSLEKDEIASLAREAGGALYALGSR